MSHKDEQRLFRQRRVTRVQEDGHLEFGCVGWVFLDFDEVVGDCRRLARRLV